MSQILADCCIPTDLIEALKTKGFSVIAASKTNLVGVSDLEIFLFAQKRKMPLLTFDRDFENILRFDILNSFGVVIVEVEHFSKKQLSSSIVEFFEKYSEEELKGCLFKISSYRIKKWPRNKG